MLKAEIHGDGDELTAVPLDGLVLDPRHAAPHEGQQGDEQEEKSATRHLPIACVALASDAMPRPHEAAGEEAGRILTLVISQTECPYEEIKLNRRA